MAETEKHSHYKKYVQHLKFIDPYRVCELFNVGGGGIEHAIKKLLVAGNRGAKDKAKDVQEAIDSLIRWQEMQLENDFNNKPEDTQRGDIKISLNDISLGSDETRALILKHYSKGEPHGS